MNKEYVINAAIDVLGFSGRLLSRSKSAYFERYPNRIIVFNGNVWCKEYGKIWFGDLDLTLDEANLQKLSEVIGCKIYIFREKDCRFGNEENPDITTAVAYYK